MKVPSSEMVEGLDLFGTRNGEERLQFGVSDRLHVQILKDLDELIFLLTQLLH